MRIVGVVALNNIGSYGGRFHIRGGGGGDHIVTWRRRILSNVTLKSRFPKIIQFPTTTVQIF
jgi:hypothetical protein